jgi:cell division protein FtsL
MAELVLSRTRAARRKRPGGGQLRRSALAALDTWLGWSGVFVAVGALVMAVCYVVSLIHVRSEVVQLGRQISVLNEQAHALETDVEEVRLRWQELDNPKRLEKIAATLKLAKPKTEQLVVLGESR